MFISILNCMEPSFYDLTKGGMKDLPGGGEEGIWDKVINTDTIQGRGELKLIRP